MTTNDAPRPGPRDILPPIMRGVQTIAISENEVERRGEELDEIWWRGAQWAVTSYGIECLDGSYYIDRKRLLENLPKYSWPEQMSEKEWVKIDEFTTAWMIGLVLHGYGRKLPKSSDIRQIFGKLWNHDTNA